MVQLHSAQFCVIFSSTYLSSQTEPRQCSRKGGLAMPSNIELHHQRQWTIRHLVAQVCTGEDAAVSCFPRPSRERRWPPNIPHICKAKGMQMPTGCGEQKEANRRELYIYISCIRFCLLSVFPSSRTPSLCLNFWSYTLENQSMTLPTNWFVQGCWGPLVACHNHKILHLCRP